MLTLELRGQREGQLAREEEEEEDADGPRVALGGGSRRGARARELLGRHERGHRHLRALLAEQSDPQER